MLCVCWTSSQPWYTICLVFLQRQASHLPTGNSWTNQVFWLCLWNLLQFGLTTLKYDQSAINICLSGVCGNKMLDLVVSWLPHQHGHCASAFHGYSGIQNSLRVNFGEVSFSFDSYTHMSKHFTSMLVFKENRPSNSIPTAPCGFCNLAVWPFYMADTCCFSFCHANCRKQLASLDSIF